MDAQRRTALIFVTQGVGCASLWRPFWKYANKDHLWVEIAFAYKTV